MKDHNYHVYFLTNWTGEVMYVGVTNNLERRVFEHRECRIPGFTKKYKVGKLVYFESYSYIETAIAREKQIKNWARKKKDALVKKINPEWTDLSIGWFEDPSTLLGMTEFDRSVS